MKKLVITNLAMIVTDACNLDCEHCMRGKKTSAKMTDEVIEKTLSQVAVIQALHICGGEPTLAVDVIRKIFKYITEKNIRLENVFITINGTIYSEELLNYFDIINNYIKTRCIDESEESKAKIIISYDDYHIKEMEKYNLLDNFYKNLIKYKNTKHFLGVHELNPKLKLIREGNAENIEDSLTTPLKIYKPIIMNYKYNNGDDVCYIGPTITVACDGTITDCNASIEHQKTIYNFGNVLTDSIYEVCSKYGEEVRPEEYEEAIKKRILMQESD